MIDNPPTETARTLAEWLRMVRLGGKTLHGEDVAHLKPEHGIGHSYGNLVAERGTSVGQLEAAGSFNAKVTHRVRRVWVEDVLEELLGWLRQAMRRHGGRSQNAPEAS